MMKKDEFLIALTKEAKAQAKIKNYHLLPSSLNSISNFFWRYTWQIVLITSFLLAIIVLYLSGIKPL